MPPFDDVISPAQFEVEQAQERVREIQGDRDAARSDSSVSGPEKD